MPHRIENILAVNYVRLIIMRHVFTSSERYTCNLSKICQNVQLEKCVQNFRTSLHCITRSVAEEREMFFSTKGLFFVIVRK
jgi:hypothetical protein